MRLLVCLLIIYFKLEFCACISHQHGRLSIRRRIFSVKDESKTVPHCGPKPHDKSGDLTPLIFNLGIRWRCVCVCVCGQLTSWLLYAWADSLQYPLDRKMGASRVTSNPVKNEKVP